MFGLLVPDFSLRPPVWTKEGPGAWSCCSGNKCAQAFPLRRTTNLYRLETRTSARSTFLLASILISFRRLD